MSTEPVRVSGALVVRAWYEDGSVRCRVELVRLRPPGECRERAVAVSAAQLCVIVERWYAGLLAEGRDADADRATPR